MRRLRGCYNQYLRIASTLQAKCNTDTVTYWIGYKAASKHIPTESVKYIINI